MQPNIKKIRISFISLIVALVFLSGTNFAYSQELFEEISDEDLELLEEVFELAQILLEEENYEEAILYLDEILAIIPSDIDALNGKGLALSNIGKHEEAIIYYDMVLEIDELEMEALNGKALALTNIGQHEEAITYYDMVLKIDHENIDALFGKALSLENLGKLEESISNVEKIETLIPPEDEFREPEIPQNEESSNEFNESNETLFIGIGVLIVIIIGAIIGFSFIRKSKSSTTTNS